MADRPPWCRWPYPRQNHCSHRGRPGHCRSRGSHITCSILLQSLSQSTQQATQSSAQLQSHNPQSYDPPIPLSSQAFTLYIPPSTTDNVTSWELPISLSQSTIGGRHGSNACTIISLLLAKTYLTNKQLLQINNSQLLSHNWIVAFISCMLGENQAYDTFTSSRNPIYLGVLEAIPLIRNSLGSLDYEEELTVCFVKEARAADESALSYQLSRRLGIANAAFTIINLWCRGKKTNRMSFSVALVKFYWFGINWHVFMQKLSYVYYYSENRATNRIWKVLSIIFFPRGHGNESCNLISS